jgi:hypothetical protein
MQIPGRKRKDDDSWSQIARRSVVVMGYRGAGKTTFVGLLTVHIDYLASKGSGISYHFEENVTNFRRVPWGEIVRKIRNGDPLNPTDLSNAPYVGRLVVKYPKLLGKVELNIPMIDLAGELYQPIMDFIFDSKSQNFDYEKWNDELKQKLINHGITKDDLQSIIDFIFKGKAYLIIINLVHAFKSISLSTNDASDGTVPLSQDEINRLLDRYLNIVTNLIYYRIKQGNRPHVGIVLTHYDVVRDYVEGRLGLYPLEDEDSKWKLMNYIGGSIIYNPLEDLTKDVPIFISYYKKPLRPIIPENEDWIRLPDYPKKEYDKIILWFKDILK